jgi:hypothetical protein
MIVFSIKMAQKMAFLTCTTASLRSVGDDLEEKILRKLNGWLCGGRNVPEIECSATRSENSSKKDGRAGTCVIVNGFRSACGSVSGPKIETSVSKTARAAPAERPLFSVLG